MALLVAHDWNLNWVEGYLVSTVKLVLKFGNYGPLEGRLANESTGKNENKSVKLVFINENDSKLFEEKFDEAVKVLEKNDFSIFPKNEIENGKSSKKR